MKAVNTFEQTYRHTRRSPHSLPIVYIYPIGAHSDHNLGKITVLLSIKEYILLMARSKTSH